MTTRPDPDLDRLVAEAAWVRKLALAVARDAHAADDLAQDAWVAALARPPRGEDRRGWFARVLRNLERLRARGDSNRGARERHVARRETDEDPTLALERLEMQEALLRCVRALAEPYRTTVVLRWFEGLDPAEVGRRTNVPLRTVHTRTTRALALLREALDRRSGGDRSRWMAAWLPLLSLRPAGSGLVPWILAMNVKLKIGLALAAGLLLFVAIRRPNTPTLVAPPAVVATTDLASGDEDEPREVALPLWPERRTPELAPRAASLPPAAVPQPAPFDPCTIAPADLARPSPPRTIEGFVRRSDAAARGGTAWLRRDANPAASATPCERAGIADADARVAFGRDGAFRFEDVMPGSYCVGVEIEDGVSRVRACDVAEGLPTPRLFFSAGAGEVVGVASGKDGAAIAGALVVLERRDGRWWPEGETATTRTSERGEFRFPARCAGRYFVTLRRDGQEPEAADAFGFELAPGDRKVVEFGSRRGLVAWTGKVLGPDGWAPTVVPEITLENLDTGLLQGAERRSDGTVHADLHHGRYAVLALLFDERKRIAEFRVRSDETETELKIPPTSVLVRVARTPGPRPALPMVSLKSRGTAHAAFGIPDAEGWRFFGVPPGEYEVRAIASPVPNERSAADFETLVVRSGDRELSIEIAAAGR